MVHLKSMAGPVAPQATYQALATFAEQRKMLVVPGRVILSAKGVRMQKFKLKSAVMLERAQREVSRANYLCQEL